jgi:4-phosphopantoate--beta-alanine ligase
LTIPPSHPRYRSLLTRERHARDVEEGIVHVTGMIAHGRGEAFDYLLGEASTEMAKRACEAAAAKLLEAERPAISVNGNVASLAAEEVKLLAQITGAKVEVNLFHRTDDRVKKIAGKLRALGVEPLGVRPDAKLPGLDSDRAKCSRDGIFSADVVLIPLEDGDRAEALKRMGKFVITIDLNPISRTSKAADIAIVDELTRALPLISDAALRLKVDPKSVERVLKGFDNQENLGQLFRHLEMRMNELSLQARRPLPEGGRHVWLGDLPKPAEATCRRCNLVFFYGIVNTGLTDVMYAYCEKCGSVLWLTWNSPDWPAGVPGGPGMTITKAHERLVKPCPCGGRFRRGARPRCPHCGFPLSEELRNSIPAMRKGWTGLHMILIEGSVLYQDLWATTASKVKEKRGRRR